MKWVFLLGLMVLTPLLVTLLRGQPRNLVRAAFCIGLLPFVLAPLHLYIGPISWSGWRGPVKGIEVSVLDSIAVALLIVVGPTRMPAVSKIGLAAISVAFLISTIAAGAIFPSTFYAWQLGRSAVLAVAVARLTAVNDEAAIAVVAGMGLGLGVEALTATWQHLHGAAQAGGNFGHQNLLGMASHFVAMPAFALLLAGKRTSLALAILFAEAVVVFVGGSRATIGLFAIGMAICTILSLMHRSSGRKTMVAGGFLIAATIAAPLMMMAIGRRSADVREDSNKERAEFQHAARLIIADHPLGIGADRYVIVANLGGYSDKAGVPWNGSQRSAPVHNSYLLIAAELGLLGLAGFILLIGSIAMTGLRSIRRTVSGERSELIVGLTAAVLIAAVHFAYEWIAMTFYIHYLFAIDAGMIVGLAAAASRRSARAVPRRAAMPELAAVSEVAV